jgi:hypothetical protein
MPPRDRSTLPLWFAACLTCLPACDDTKPSGQPASSSAKPEGKAPTLVMDATSAPPGLADFKGKNTLKGTLNADGTLPAGTRVTLTIKSVGANNAGFHSQDDGGDCTKALDLTADASVVPFEVKDLADGAYRLKAIAFLNMKARLKDKDAARRLLGKGDYIGVHAGANVAMQDVKQAKPVEVNGGQVVEASFQLGKIP